VLEPGWHRFAWDRTVTGGGPAAPGIFVVRLRAGTEARTRKLVLLP
jgi:hypothetical protein